MDRRGSWTAVGVIGVLFLLALWGSPRSLWNVLTDPWRLVWGSHQQLQTTLIDVSETDEVRAAGRKLLKPFGMLRLNRVIDPADSTS